MKDIESEMRETRENIEMITERFTEMTEDREQTSIRVKNEASQLLSKWTNIHRRITKHLYLESKSKRHSQFLIKYQATVF